MTYARFNPEINSYNPEPEIDLDAAHAFLDGAYLAEENTSETSEIDLRDVSKNTIEAQQLALDSIYKKNDQ